MPRFMGAQAVHYLCTYLTKQWCLAEVYKFCEAMLHLFCLSLTLLA